MPPLNVILAIYPDYKTDETETLDASAPGFDQTPDSDRIPIRGINSDLPVRFSKDGGAVPGDNIVGILVPGEGITIYPSQSKVKVLVDEFMEMEIDIDVWGLSHLTQIIKQLSEKSITTKVDRITG